MAEEKPTNQALRSETQVKIWDAGMTLMDASATYGFSGNTIYTFFRDDVIDAITIIKNDIGAYLQSEKIE